MNLAVVKKVQEMNLAVQKKKKTKDIDNDKMLMRHSNLYFKIRCKTEKNPENYQTKHKSCISEAGFVLL